MRGTDDFRHASRIHLCENGLKSAYQVGKNRRPPDLRRCVDLYRIRAREKEFGRIFGHHDPADTDQWQSSRLTQPINGGDRERADRRSGQTTEIHR